MVTFVQPSDTQTRFGLPPLRAPVKPPGGSFAQEVAGVDTSTLRLGVPAIAGHHAGSQNDWPKVVPPVTVETMSIIPCDLTPPSNSPTD